MKDRHSPPLRGAHQVQLLQGGQELFPELVRALDQSAHEVRMETYIFNADASGELVADALVRAAQRGVAVYLVIDGVGTPELPAQWTNRFENAGVQWRIFKPLGRLGLLIPNRWRRLHRKLCVIDGQLVFCGGINLQDDQVDINYGTLDHPRFDFAVRVTGPLVRSVHEVMAQFWWRQQAVSQLREMDITAAWHELQEAVRQAMTEEASADPESVAPSGNNSGTRAALLLRDNLRNRNRIERAYRKAIAEAREEIIIANAYFLPGHKLRKALIHAARRGVRVRLLLQGRYEYFMQFHAARMVYGVLLGAGIEIHEYAPSFLHAKVAVIDGLWATVGSSNLDPLSLLLAREANVVVNDARFAKDLRDRLVHAMDHEGQRVDPAVYANRPWLQRLLDRMAFALMRFGVFLSGNRY
jgi:cardiolipin synthase A/B